MYWRNMWVALESTVPLASLALFTPWEVAK